MKIIPTSIIIVFVLIISSSSYLFSLQELSQEQLLGIYSKIIEKLNLPNSYEGIDGSKYDKDLKVVFKIDEDRLNKKVAVIGRRGKYEIILDAESGDILSFSNRLVREKISNDRLLFKKGEQPKNKREDIIKEAEKYVKLFNNDKFPKDYILESAHFSITASLNNEIDYAGEWIVVWRRHIDGYKVWGDGILVGIDEKYGFVSYLGKTHYNYSPPKKINISEANARELARGLGTALINDKNFHFYNYCKGYKLGEVTDAQMMIVPVNVKDHIYLGFKTSNSRLCWLVNFMCVSIAPEKGDSSFPVGFCIDAETGELVGFR